MNWEMVGAVGQVAGAGLVAVSFVYLGVQVRLSNRLAKAEAFRAVAMASGQVLTAQATDPVFRKAFHKVWGEQRERDELESDERVAFSLWLSSQLVLLEQIHREEAIGILPSEALNVGRSIYQLPYFRGSWPYLRANYSEDYASHVDQLLGSANGIDKA